VCAHFDICARSMNIILFCCCAFRTLEALGPEACDDERNQDKRMYVQDAHAERLETRCILHGLLFLLHARHDAEALHPHRVRPIGFSRLCTSFVLRIR
jgi:hypothetical protein